VLVLGALACGLLVAALHAARGAWSTLLAPTVGTLSVALIALGVAVPLGLLAATYLSELATPLERRVLRPLLTAFASIPGVAFGWIAVVIVSPALVRVVPPLAAQPLVAPGLVLGAMMIPLVASLAQDALAAVPRALREAGWALGISRLHVIVRVVWPAARAGMAAAVLLAALRAVGETMIVWVAAGQPATLTTTIAERALTARTAGQGEVAAAAVLLVVLTIVLDLAAHRWVRRVRSWA
jgi:phosphate transport system permease protein